MSCSRTARAGSSSIMSTRLLMLRAASSVTSAETVPRNFSNARSAFVAQLDFESLLFEVCSRSSLPDSDASADETGEVSAANVGGWGETPVVPIQGDRLPRVSRRVTRWG